jgi:cell division protease FtsH
MRFLLLLFALSLSSSFNLNIKSNQNKLYYLNNYDKEKLKYLDSELEKISLKINKIKSEKKKILSNIEGQPINNSSNHKYIDDNDEDDEDYFANEFSGETEIDYNKLKSENFFPINEPGYINPVNSNNRKKYMDAFFIRHNIKMENDNSNNNLKSENFEVIKDSSFNFKNVGGYEIIKEELLQSADMLLNFDKYSKFNVRVPKGLILEGPPGNGKTLIAKSFCGEIKVGFIPVSGAQFQEKYVGVGASRVRELFKLAKDNTPCVVFIDEIDAIGRKRSTDDNSQPERDSTLNELLVNLDGFKTSNGIFLMGATNRVDLLDPALIRPGRIDKKIYVGNPDRKTREAILNIHLKGKPMNKDINLQNLVELTNGFSSAEIENFLNEAMLYALRKNRNYINMNDFELIANRVLVGFQSVENKISKEMLIQVAVHEMGHALIGLFTNYKKLIKVTINLWSPKSLGFTLFEPDEEQKNLITKEQLINELMVLLGGRVAEEIIYENKYSSGASHDLEQTKKIAENMIVNFGMGLKVVMPHISEKYKELIDKEIEEVIGIAYQRAKFLLINSKPLLKECAELLAIEYEITPEDILNRINKKYQFLNNYMI